MGLVVINLDTILISLSIFVTVGYHAYLWHSFKTKPSLTTFGLNSLKRRAWFQDLNSGDEKKGTLAVQSLRNTLMESILTASVSILVVLALFALVNNAYGVTHLFRNPLFGSHSAKLVSLKCGSAALTLSMSFMFASMAVASLIDANFLINAGSCSPEQTRTILEKGFVLALLGNRMLCVTFPLLLWMLGPVPVWLTSFALALGLYQLDFAGRLRIM